MIMIRRVVGFECRDNPEYDPNIFTINIFNTKAYTNKYLVKNNHNFEVLFEDGTKQNFIYATSRECVSGNNEPRFTGIADVKDNKMNEEEVYLQIINNLNSMGYHANEKYISLFFNKKIDKLFLKKNNRNLTKKKSGIE